MSYQFALIGCGRIGNRHAAQIATQGQLLAVCDTDAAKAAALGQQYSAQIYGSISELLRHQQPDVVSICPPNGLPAGNGANNYGHYQGSMSNHDKVYKQLTAALQDPSQHLLEAEEALLTIELIEHIYQASPLIP